MKNRVKVGLALVSLMAFSAQAESVKVDMTAGLWQNKMTWDGDGMKEMQALQTEEMTAAMAQMKEQFATMPPEQRKQMEAIMAQSGLKMKEDGVSFNNDQLQISSSGTNVKSCITQAEIDRGGFPDNAEGCKSSIQKISANRFKATFVCAGEEQSAGESEVTFHSPKHYSGSGKMTAQFEGKPRVMTFKMEGTWLSSDCGTVAPVSQ
jgi:guanyl-specific ribonuclease Sa